MRTWKYNVCGDREMYAGFLCRNLKERDHFKDLGIDGRRILNWISRK